MRQRNIPILWGFPELGIPLSYSIRHRVLHSTSSYSERKGEHTRLVPLQYRINGSFKYKRATWTNAWSLDEHVILCWTRIRNQTCIYVAPGGDHNINTSVTQCINISQIRPRWLKTLASLAPPVYTRQELWIEKRNLERTARLCSSGANERTIRLPLWKYRVT